MAIDVMVTISGINEDGKYVSSLHTFKVNTEQEVKDWVAQAPAISRNIDNGPEIRVEIPGRGRGRRKE